MTVPERMAPYLYRGWKVHHYVEVTEQFIACQGGGCLRAKTKVEIKREIDRVVTLIEQEQDEQE